MSQIETTGLLQERSGGGFAAFVKTAAMVIWNIYLRYRGERAASSVIICSMISG